MKFVQFLPYYKRKKFIENKISFYKTCGLKTSSRLFCVSKEFSASLLGNEILGTIYLYQICISKAIKICPNHHIDLLRFQLTQDSLKIKKDLEIVSRPCFHWYFSSVMLHKLAKFHHHIVFTFYYYFFSIITRYT